MRCLELFCGAGGMSLGFQQAGFEIVGAVDNWGKALRVYERNLGCPTFEADINDISTVALWGMDLRPQIVIFGSPCQEFSAAGSQEEGAIAFTTLAAVMIVNILRPQWMVLENVPPMLESETWIQAKTLLRDAGYGLSISIVDACFYRTPQHRKRTIVVARLAEADGSMVSAISAAATKAPMTVREGLGDDAPLGPFYMKPRYDDKRSVHSIDEPSSTVRSVSYRPVPAKFRELSDQPLSKDIEVDSSAAVFVRRSGAGAKSRSVIHPKDACHPSEAVDLTLHQLALLQGFPPNFEFSLGGGKTTIAKLIANAVPPPLAAIIGAEIFERARGESIPEIEAEFLNWLKDSAGRSVREIRNIGSRINRARRLLGGRVYADPGKELFLLEQVPEFAMLCSALRSDLRTALRHYQEWRRQVQENQGAESMARHWGSNLAVLRKMGLRMGGRQSRLMYHAHLIRQAHMTVPPVLAANC